MVLADGAPPAKALDAWLARNAAEVVPVDALLQDISAAPTRDLAMLTVVDRQLRSLAA